MSFFFFLFCSGKDQMLPSSDESQRLKSSLKNCTVRHFKENGHTVLLVREEKWLHQYLCLNNAVVCIDVLLLLLDSYIQQGLQLYQHLNILFSRWFPSIIHVYSCHHYFSTLHHNLVKVSHMHDKLNVFLILPSSLLCSRERPLCSSLYLVNESYDRLVFIPVHLIFLAMNASPL